MIYTIASSQRSTRNPIESMESRMEPKHISLEDDEDDFPAGTVPFVGFDYISCIPRNPDCPS